ncbi:MAG: hypothetical protein NT074_00520 [Methanomicrobiales archaeon]|jgi:hypothetical protein|nr:hypothetical protein [Methanomicrobiales archaeon]
MGSLTTLLHREIVHPSRRQILIGLVCGLCAASTFLLQIIYSLGGGLYLDPSEIFVTLGAALGGPVGGVIAGLLQGVVHAPERNIPSHMIAGFLWGVWYLILWQIITGRTNQRTLLAVLWVLTIPVYYNIFLLPLNLWIYSVTILHEPFIPVYLTYIIRALPEVVLTAFVSGVAIALIPEGYTNPELRTGNGGHSL